MKIRNVRDTVVRSVSVKYSDSIKIWTEMCENTTYPETFFEMLGTIVADDDCQIKICFEI